MINTGTAVTRRTLRDERSGGCVPVYARADVQAISAVPGCDQQHARPCDSRTGFPVPIWELTCPAHEAWILGADRPKVMEWESTGDGGYRQVKVSQPRSTEFSPTIEGIPLTPDQMRSEARRNGLTRRAEQSALQQGLAAMALAYDHQPATKELLQARQFAGKATATCLSCYAVFVAGPAFCPDCGVRVPTVVPAAAETVEA